MAHAEESITIHRPVNAVFDFVLDGTNSPLWRPGIVDIQRVPGKPSGLGAVIRPKGRGCIPSDDVERRHREITSGAFLRPRDRGT